VTTSTDELKSAILPDWDKLSVLTAMLTLAYIFTRLVSFPEQDISLRVGGILLSVRLDLQTIVSILVAGLMAAGADWLLRDHPKLSKRSAAPHWILPSLTALVIGIPLRQLSYELMWWLLLLGGNILLALILIGEFISIDSEDIRQPLAAIGLTAASFALLFILASGLHSARLRLFIIIPILSAAVWMVSLRTLHVRLHGQWLVYETMIVAFLVAQLASALTYWPVTSIAFGLVLVGLTYALNSIISGLIEEKSWREIILEPIIAMILSIGMALWLQ
jgi:hypothetical protein